jgi:hypothetical protein
VEARACLGGARREVSLAGKLMRKRMLVEHFLRMRTSGGSESGIPLERSLSLFGAGLVGQVEELLLLRRWGLLRRGECGEKECEDDDELLVHL